MEQALLNKDYVAICRQLSSGGKIDEQYKVRDDLLCGKNRLYVPKELRKSIMSSEQDSKIVGHFGRERTMELVTRYFYWPRIEVDVRKYCNECDNGQRTKTPRHTTHGSLHPPEMAAKPWMHISTNFITDLLESEGAAMISVVVDRYTEMAHFIPIKKRIARRWLEPIWKMS